MISRTIQNGVEIEEVRFLTGSHGGQELWMHGYICRPETDTLLAPVLLIPGGNGKMNPDVARWTAAQAAATVLLVDWIGVGGSSPAPGLNPWGNAFYYDGDIRSSFQMHNVRAFLQATEVLLARPEVDASRLAAIGYSWGGFYSLLLGGVDPRFRSLHASYGCGFLDLGCRQLWVSQQKAMPAENVETWLRTFDPGRRAHLSTADVWYAQATNDRYFSLEGTMATYHQFAGDKRLLLVRNQDHSLHPYEQEAITVLRETIAGRFATSMPRVEAEWIPGTASVEVTLSQPEFAESVTVMYSAGDYTSWPARRWRAAAARRESDAWVAEIPVVGANRELWFYGHADNGRMAASSPVAKIVPAEAGFSRPSALVVPGFDFASESFWNLPIGDRNNPELRAVEGPGVHGLAITFDDSPELRAVVYCLEGDLIAADGYNGLELLVRLPDPAALAGLKLIVDTDYNRFEEQAYGIDLAALGTEFGDWTRVRVRFGDLDPVTHQRYPYRKPEQRPLDVSRICGVGFRRETIAYRGEVQLADIRLLHLEPGPKPVSPLAPTVLVEEPEPVETLPEATMTFPSELRIDTTLRPDELRERLRAWAPWRHEVVFSNGVRTGEFEHGKWFLDRPLQKWVQLAPHLPLETLRGGRALDVGSNIGQFSLVLRRDLEMSVTGLELSKRNLAVARFLLETAGLDRVEFVEADASFWNDAAGLDLILHLGTLDHLRHPLLGLENAAAMLKPDGYLALELQVLSREDDGLLCRYVGESDTSTTCCWFIGKEALRRMLLDSGFDRIRNIFEWSRPELIGADMARLVVIAQKKSVGGQG